MRTEIDAQGLAQSAAGLNNTLTVGHHFEALATNADEARLRFDANPLSPMEVGATTADPAEGKVGSTPVGHPSCGNARECAMATAAHWVVAEPVDYAASASTMLNCEAVGTIRIR
jgi:hypothetical protein